jgi:hypothetical protein
VTRETFRFAEENNKGEKRTMAAKKSGGKARSAVTGKYVKPAEAKKHPKTTVVERDKRRPKR